MRNSYFFYAAITVFWMLMWELLCFQDWEHCKLDEFVLLTLCFAIFNMSNQYSEDHVSRKHGALGFDIISGLQGHVSIKL